MIKKTLLFIAIIIMSLSSFGQSPLGIGLVKIAFDDKTVIDFYDSPEFSNKLKTIEFFNDKAINSWNIKNLENHQKDWLSPETLWLDYSQFTFRCKTKIEDCFEVYVSDTKTMWIKATHYTHFTTWESYLQGMFSIERLNPETQEIYSRPYPKSAIIEATEDCFKVLQLSKDEEWIEIKTADHCETEDKISGWIQWRDGDNILIDYHTTS